MGDLVGFFVAGGDFLSRFVCNNENYDLNWMDWVLTAANGRNSFPAKLRPEEV